jgi:hypothetical protein
MADLQLRFACFASDCSMYGPSPHDDTPPLYATAPLTARPATSSSAAYRSRGSLTSRAHNARAPGVARPVERYNPAATLAARAATIKSSSPPRYKRQVQRNPDVVFTADPFARDATPGADPVQRLHQAHLEQQWQSPDIYSSMHNDGRHQSQHRYFSEPKPVCAIDPITLPPRAAGVPQPLNKHAPSFRQMPSNPLHALLEHQWKGAGPELHTSYHNTYVPKAQRQYFDTPQRQQLQLSHELLHMLELKQNHVEQAMKDRMAKNLSGASKNRTAPRLSQRRHSAQQLMLAALPPQLLSPDSDLPSEHRSASPDRVLTGRRIPALAGPSQLLAEALDPLGSIPLHNASSLLPPPAFLSHPRSRFFRFIPKRDSKEVVRDLKREREWNERHQIERPIGAKIRGSGL